MTMVASKLKDELVAMDLFTLEVEAINAWATAFTTYFADAAAGGIPAVPAALEPCKAAMIGAMTGLSTAGKDSIQAGIVAFWGVVATASPVIWAGTLSATPPPTLSGIAAALEPVFAANTSGSLSEEDSMNNIATVIHTNNLGGTAAMPPPVPPVPIL